MNSLLIKATEDSPLVNFDTSINQFVISGESRPEHTTNFYTPLVKWIDDYENNMSHKNDKKNPLTFIFKLTYFNSTSAKYIMDILMIIKKIIKKNNQTTVEWHYDSRDDDMLDAGKEFEDVVDLKFHFVKH
jgi:hypothetical protein